jgi:hypothetical protein
MIDLETLSLCSYRLSYIPSPERQDNEEVCSFGLLTFRVTTDPLNDRTTAWPRPFRLANTNTIPGSQFTIEDFQNAQGLPPWLYPCETLEQSEEVARLFFNEPVEGYDQEWIYPWPSSPSLQEHVSVIQVATDEKVAIFHIGRNQGDTPSDLIAPSLRILIEDRAILKAGLAIMGNFWRLHEHFGLQLRGALQLSYLQKLISQNRGYDNKYVLGGLAKMVELNIRNYTLQKDSGMQENWLLPLNPLCRQYAAAYVYASIMLFHRLNAQRLDMTPCPPLPRRSEEYMEFFTKIVTAPVPFQLEPIRAGATYLSADYFFALHKGLEEDPEPEAELDAESQKLIDLLSSARDVQATRVVLLPLNVATDTVLRTIALHRPLSYEALMSPPGLKIYKHRVMHRDVRINAVRMFMESQQVSSDVTGSDSLCNGTDSHDRTRKNTHRPIMSSQSVPSQSGPKHLNYTPTFPSL